MNNKVNRKFNQILAMSLSFFIFHGLSQAKKFDVNHIQAYNSSYSFYKVDGSTEDELVGSWTDKVRIDKNKISRTVIRKNAEGDVDLIKTVVAHKESLQPIFQHQRFGAGLEKLLYSEFKDLTLQQFYLGNLEAQSQSISSDFEKLPVEVNLQGLFAAALNLDSSEMNVLGYRLGPSSKLIEVTFKNLGKEIVEIAGDQLEAWKITEPESDWVYWVRKEFPYLIQVSHPSADGHILISKIDSYELMSNQ